MSDTNFWVIVKRLFFFILLIILTPVLLIEGIVTAITKVIRKKKWKEKELDGHRLILESGITDIDLMEGYMFEDYLRVLLFYQGYKVEQTQKSRDYGADLILTEPQTKQKIVVQAKRYSKPVGSKSVQEVLAAKLHYKAEDAWVIATNTFTPQAELLAKENSIRLIDRQELIEMYKKVQEQFKIDGNDGTLYASKITLQEKYPHYI